MKALTRKHGNGRGGASESPETGLGRIRDEMDRAMARLWRGGFPDFFSSWMPEQFFPAEMKTWAVWPAIDVGEDDKGIVIRADVPGLDAKDVEVEIAGNVLTIRGSREEAKEEKTASVSRHERRFGKFERAITLPPYIDAEKVEAKYDKGTLTVTAPRVPGEGPKRVEVKTS